MTNELTLYQEIYGPPPTSVEIIKEVLGKKFIVDKVDGEIRIKNKKTLRVVLMKVKIVAHGGSFATYSPLLNPTLIRDGG